MNNSQLKQWPVQIKLINSDHSSFNNSILLVAADCCAYAYNNFQDKFMKDKVTIIGCPKLDDIDYTNKLEEIFTKNDIKEVYVTRMEVPCCTGIKDAVIRAVNNSNKDIDVKDYVISLEGEILE